MPSVRQLRGRIRGVRSTSRVTRAMQMVAASKMRRAQDRALGARPYAEKLRAVLARVAGEATTDSPHPLLEVRPVQHTLVLEVPTDAPPVVRGRFGSGFVRERLLSVAEGNPQGAGCLDELIPGTDGLENADRVLQGSGLNGSAAQAHHAAKFSARH